MHRLYCVLKDRHSPPTPDEVAYATGQKKLDGHTEAKYFNKLEKVSENIKKAFEDQKACTVVSTCAWGFTSVTIHYD